MSSGQMSGKGVHNKKVGLVVAVAILAVVLLIAGPIVFFMTDVFLPQSNYYTVAVKLQSGELLQMPYVSGMGAVNKKGEFLIDYNANNLAAYISFYYGAYYDAREEEVWIVHPDSWVVTEAENPYYSGRIISMNPMTETLYSSQIVYDSVNSYHYEDEFYNPEGKTMWSYNSMAKKDKLFQTVIETTSFQGETTADFTSYLNVNQFLMQEYGIEVKTECDKKSRLVVFVVPQTLQDLPKIGVEE